MPSYVPDHESTAPQLPHTAPTHMTDRDRRFYEQSPTTEYGSPQFYTNSSTSHSRNVPMSPTSPHHSHSYQIVSSSTAHYPPEMNTVTSPKQALSTGSAKQLSSLEGIHTSFNSLSNRPVEVHNLLGPIHASAARLLDDQDRPGIFFVFQDLSIRTEGQFRLKINLMTIAAGAGTQTISSQDAAPVLAEAWTEPFNVYPPKRFPGVPDPTPLSTTFGRQGQKLPTVCTDSILLYLHCLIEPYILPARREVGNLGKVACQRLLTVEGL
ncbi:hypothetical protein BS47DRAFT_804058 [Hydnum rufescens UP504]|uniref:Velvet domain-containing protein n=1 Tax=Hydnum rufescens UP504 TaxID=1448309 RepID=A0A9P6B0U6_9AGAM|nr:hypothetical protein BS47DRAFT_804058 [Hydnum rufescens UP504]